MRAAILILACAVAQAINLPMRTAVHINYNEVTKMVEFTARVRMNAYLAIGFGPTMEDTSMILWQSKGLSSAQTQLYSKSNKETPEVVTNEWTSTFTFNQTSGFVDFISTRPLSSINGFNFQLDVPIKICYAWNFLTSDLVNHGENNHGTVDLTLKSAMTSHLEPDMPLIEEPTDSTEPSSTTTTSSGETQTTSDTPTYQTGLGPTDVIFDVPRVPSTEVIDKSPSSNSTMNYTNPWYDAYRNARDKFGNMAQKTPPYTHGIMMWCAWTLCGIAQVVSARYMGIYYEGRVRLHMVSGVFTCMLASLAFLFAWSNADFEFKLSYHSIAGYSIIV